MCQSWVPTVFTQCLQLCVQTFTAGPPQAALAHFLSILPLKSQEARPVLISSVHSGSSVEPNEGYLLHRCFPDQYHDSISRLQLWRDKAWLTAPSLLHRDELVRSPHGPNNSSVTQLWPSQSFCPKATSASFNSLPLGPSCLSPFFPHLLPLLVKAVD